MRTAAKMMMASRRRDNGQRQGEPYPTEGRYEPDNRYEPENRRSRRTGRYLPKNEYRQEQWDIPRRYEGDDRYDNRYDNRYDDRYRTDDGGDRMIGFDDGQMHYGKHGQQEHMEHGRADSHESDSDRLDRKTAVEWVNRMQGGDGSRGAHFTMDQTERVRQSRGWEQLDPVEFWVAVNAMWSDFLPTARKYTVDDMEFWADLARDFLTDKDAKKNKLTLYYRYIVKRDQSSPM